MGSKSIADIPLIHGRTPSSVPGAVIYERVIIIITIRISIKCSALSMSDAKAVAQTTPPVVLNSWRVLEGIYLRIVEGDGYNA